MQRAVESRRDVPLEGECPHPRAAPECHLSPPPSCPAASTGAPSVPGHTSCSVQANSDCWGKRSPAGASLISSSSPASGMQHLEGFSSIPPHALGSLSIPHTRSLLSSCPWQQRVPHNPPGSTRSPPIHLHLEPCSTAPWPQPTPAGTPLQQEGLNRVPPVQRCCGGTTRSRKEAVDTYGPSLRGEQRGQGLQGLGVYGSILSSPGKGKTGRGSAQWQRAKDAQDALGFRGACTPKIPVTTQMQWVLMIPPFCSYDGAVATQGCSELPQQATMCSRAWPQNHPRPRALAGATLWAALQRNPHQGGSWISPTLLNLPAEIPSGDSPSLLGSQQRPWQVPGDASSCRRGDSSPCPPPGILGCLPHALPCSSSL